MGKVFGKESQYPSAGMRWTNAEEEELRKSFEKGLTMDQLVNILGRGPGGIFVRLKKLQLVPEDLELEAFDRYFEGIRSQHPAGHVIREKNHLRNKILENWERVNWELQPDQRERFLRHPTLTKLLDLNYELIYRAISIIGLKKLDEIYGYVYGIQLESTLEDSDARARREHRDLKSRARKRALLDIDRDLNRLKRSVVKKSKEQIESERTGERVSRGSESFRQFGTVNPPPAQAPHLKHTSLYKCSICKKPVVGNSCACDGW